MKNKVLREEQLVKRNLERARNENNRLRGKGKSNRSSLTGFGGFGGIGGNSPFSPNNLAKQKNEPIGGGSTSYTTKNTSPFSNIFSEHTKSSNSSPVRRKKRKSHSKGKTITIRMN